MSVSDNWGRVGIERDETGNMCAVLENSKLFCSYKNFLDHEHPLGVKKDFYECSILDLTIKEFNENQAAKSHGFNSVIDAQCWREHLKEAYVKYDGPDVKTLRLEWEKEQGPDPISEISIFKDKALLKIDYISWYVNIVDIGSPGGGKGKYEIYGADKWKRDYVLYENTYFNGTDTPCGCDIPKEEPEPLVYNGHFITGIYNGENGRGYARVMPASHIDILKLLFEKGFEFFPEFGREHHPFTGYIYLVTEGPEEIIWKGKRIADGNLDI